MDTGGPYLNAALLCEKVLQEKDGVLSVIRVIDRFTITAATTSGAAPESIPPSAINFHIVIVLKSGVFKGTTSIKMVIHAPSGQMAGEATADVFLEGDDRGVNLVSEMRIQVQEDGLYWVDVYCGGQLLTRVPLRVIYQRVSQGSLTWPPGSQ